jgi:hypothetical protein
MKTFRQYLEEALDKPFDYKSTGTYKNSSGEDEHHYSFEDHKGKKTYVYIAHSPYNSGKKDDNLKASVDFTDENGDIQATGKGSIRHISTVRRIMKDHAEKHPKLKMYTFTGEKDHDKPGEGGRNKLYTRLAKMHGGDTEDISAYSNRHYIPVNRDKK